MKNLEDKTLTTSKQAYVKPTMEVYEMEMEGIIAASGQDRDYRHWSNAELTPFESPINPSNNA